MGVPGAEIGVSLEIPMRRSFRFAGLVATVAAGIVAAMLLSVTPAAAHTELIQASPATTQRVGGDIDFVDFIFAESISDMRVTVEDPDGELVTGEVIEDSGQLIRFEMDPIVQEGRYLVRYDMTSADGDFTESVFFFNYEVDAAQPFRLGDAQVPEPPAGSSAPIFISVIVGFGLAGLAMLYLSRLERRRAKANPAIVDENSVSGSDENRASGSDKNRASGSDKNRVSGSDVVT